MAIVAVIVVITFVAARYVFDIDIVAEIKDAFVQIVDSIKNIAGSSSM
jgi:hypothetical protein